MVGSSPDACSTLSVQAGEPLAGSAPYARYWLVLEEPGPWGRDALRDSAIPRSVVEFCEQLSVATPVRVIAARHGSRRRLSPSDVRNVWLARCDALGGELRHARVTSLDAITEWDLSALADDRLPAIGSAHDARMEFICTHSGRDACCALAGRARAVANPNAWECSHLGGHRFAATSLVLPDGLLFGRLDATTGLDATHLRGASYLTPALQAAEAAVRVDLGLDPFTHLSTRLSTQALLPDVDSGQECVVRVADERGGAWSVLCEAHPLVRPASCLRGPEHAIVWRVRSIAPEFEGEIDAY